MTTLVSTITATATPTSLFSDNRRQNHKFPVTRNHVNTTCPRSLPLLHVTNDEKKETSTIINIIVDVLEADKIVDEMNLFEICNEFECISSPLVESSARQLVRDILELRQGNRALGTYALSVTYKDPVRSFSGREKYKRPLWVTETLENTKVVNSKFTLNQISGQVIEHEETWDLSESSPIAQAYFWASRRLFAIKEVGKDTVDSIKSIGSKFSMPKEEDVEVYPDPSGDPTKFFQRNDDFQRDVYQIGLFLAIVYFVVQYLKATL
ncbi:hypothetical protein KSS87_009532 [Heliosperma pusillum]|nr:hypothetical protein KSS87_009532 [Heliosperma pusillum]